MASEEQILRQKGAKDRWLVAYWIVLLQGLASALPWNVFITETEFFDLRVHQPPYTRVLANNFESINLLTSMAGNLVGFLLYVPLHHRMSLDVQVLWPQILTLGIMMASVVLTLKDKVPGDAFMAVILSSQVVLGITNATITGGVYHIASWLPPSYIQGMSLGIGLSGTAVSAISFLTLWAVPRGREPPSPAEVAPAAFSYFLGSAGIVLLAVLTYYAFFMLPYVHSHCIPEVVAEWSGEGKDELREPPNLRRESATFLRCKTRSMSVDSLSASLSRSISELERPLLNGRSCSFLADDSQQRTSASFSIRPTDSSPNLQEDEISLPASAPAKAGWMLLVDSDEEDESTSTADADKGQGASSPALNGDCEDLSCAPLPAGGGLLPALYIPEVQRPGCSHNHMPHPPHTRVSDTCEALPSSSGISCSGSAASIGSPILGQGCGRDTATPHSREPCQPASSEVALAFKQEGICEEDDLPLLEVMRRMWGYNLVAGLGCICTMATFPGVTSAICSVHNDALVAPCSPSTPHGRFYGDLFVPFMFLVCNASDVCGRLLAGIGPWCKDPPHMPLLVLYALLRVPLLLPLLFCNIITPSPWKLPLLFRSDVWPLGLVTLMGLTNGHLQSLALMHAPSVLPKSAKDRTGPVINLALALGTTAGSVLSFAFTYFLQQA